MIDYQRINMSYPPIAGAHLSGLSGQVSHNKTSSSLVALRAKHDRELKGKLDKYERELSTALHKISANQRELKQSMLAYSDRAHSINKRRYYFHEQEESTVNDYDHYLRRTNNRSNLSIQARHIPKRKPHPRLAAIDLDYKKRLKVSGTEDESQHGVEEDEDKMYRGYTVPPLGHHKRRQKGSYQPHFATAADLTDLLQHRTIHRDVDTEKEPNPSTAWDLEGKLDSRQPSGSVNQTPVNTSNNNTNANAFLTTLPEVDSRTSSNVVNGRHQSANPRLSQENDPDTTSELESQSTKAVLDTSEQEQTAVKREAETKKLLADAIRKLQDIEKKISDPLLSLPKIKNRKKNKKLELKNSLDAIPEDEENRPFVTSKNDLHTDIDGLNPDGSRKTGSNNTTTSDNERKVNDLDEKHKSGKGRQPKNRVHTNVDKANGSRIKVSSKLPPVHQSKALIVAEDTFKSRRLMLNTKMKQKPKRLRFLQAY